MESLGTFSTLRGPLLIEPVLGSHRKWFEPLAWAAIDPRLRRVDEPPRLLRQKGRRDGEHLRNKFLPDANEADGMRGT